MFISLQAAYNFPPAGQISLQSGMVSLVYFFIFPSVSQNFLARNRFAYFFQAWLNGFLYAAVNGKLELTLLKGRQRFDTVSTSNLKV